MYVIGCNAMYVSHHHVMSIYISFNQSCVHTVQTGNRTGDIMIIDYSPSFCKGGCDSSPCRNNGSCTPTGLHSYSCSCLPGFAGVDCEKTVPMSPCGSENDYCMNGGSCYMVARDAYECWCPVMYTGKRCEKSKR